MSESGYTHNDTPLHGSEAADDALKKALADRDELLERHPHLRASQAEIDRILDKSGNHQGRMAVLATLMQGKLLEMQKELYNLADILHDTLDAQMSAMEQNNLS